MMDKYRQQSNLIKSHLLYMGYNVFSVTVSQKFERVHFLMSSPSSIGGKITVVLSFTHFWDDTKLICELLTRGKCPDINLQSTLACVAIDNKFFVTFTHDFTVKFLTTSKLCDAPFYTISKALYVADQLILAGHNATVHTYESIKSLINGSV